MKVFQNIAGLRYCVGAVDDRQVTCISFLDENFYE